MSLGNVSSVRVNSGHYHQALVYLRRAAEMTDYELPLHLQQYAFFEAIDDFLLINHRYLDEYGPLGLLD
jgi:hypothetical protein